MEPIYRQTFTVTEPQTDRFGRAKPSALLYFIQEAAGRHSSLMALDWESLARRHLFWAISRNKLQITRLPRLGETITVETWPMPTTRVAYPRSVVAYDGQHNELFRSISLWVLMDTRTRAMILPGKSGVVVDGSLTGTELTVPHSLIPHPMEQVTQRTVGYTLLDRNGHMNNTYYLDWVLDLLPGSFHEHHPVQEVTLCYLSEAKEAEKIDLHWELTDGPVLTVDAHRAGAGEETKKERVFSAQLLFE